MLGISEKVITHEFNIDPSIKLMPRSDNPWGRKIVIRQEVAKLADARFVKEIIFQTWVANPVFVKACHKDS